MFRTRQAPSPTGYLHFGTARTMLFTKLIAMNQSGSWFLRIEDTDQSRLQPGAVTNMLEAMDELGIQADEGVTTKPVGVKNEQYNIYQEGKYGPYIQSQRLNLYHQHAQTLIDKRLAYWNYLTEADKQELQEIKQSHKKPINYFLENINRNPSFNENNATTATLQERYTQAEQDTNKLFQSVTQALNDPLKPALMYRLQRNQTVSCTDILLGKTDFDLNLEEDFVILKSDGFPTYHLAHLVDDYLMKTTVIIRSQEWFPSLPKHLTMFKDLWNTVPEYLHLPFILGEIGNKKMSKRDGNVNMKDYLIKGYLPEAIINYLAFLGWNPGTEQELFLEPQDFVVDSKTNFRTTQKLRLAKLMQNLAQHFTVDKLSKSPARFSLEKLNWFNREYIKMMSLPEYAFWATENKTRQYDPTATTRIGDYVYLVDEKLQEVYVETDARKPGVENNFHPVGGGREEGLDSITNLSKEVIEETCGQLEMNTKKLLKVAQFQLANGNYTKGDVIFNAKDFFVYYYAVNKNSIKPSIEDDLGELISRSWVDIEEVIAGNEVTTYPIWSQFCIQNNLPYFVPKAVIRQQYLAQLLDQNRITVLSEAKTDSEAVLNWQKPSDDILKWKKISLEESKTNLKELLPIIIQTYTQIAKEQEDLYLSVFTTEIKEKSALLSQKWEYAIKTWLAQNEKDTGSYLWPLRVALSGLAKSPSPFELLTILNLEQTQSRIESSLE